MEFNSNGVLILSITAATIPALIYTGVIYWFDRYEKEPAWLLAATFLWGAVPSIILAVIVSTVVSAPFQVITGPALGDTLSAVVIAPPVEETIKALALVAIFLFLRDEIDGLLDGIIYGAMVGMGFAMVENVFYFVAVYEESGIDAWRTNILLRAVLFGLNHSLFSSATGLGLAVARFSPRREVRVVAPFLGWSAAVALHAIHNLGASLGGAFCLILPFTDWGGVLLLFVIIVWAVWQERRWLRTYLREEVETGTITRRQYETACSGRARLRHRLSALFTRGAKAYLDATHFYRYCSELAYKKHHYERLNEASTRNLTESLRDRISRLSRRLVAVPQ